MLPAAVPLRARPGSCFATLSGMTTGRAQRLLEWFAANRRELPWRGAFPRDAYRVLVSEVMLQQTQVDRVVGGFGPFIERFPTLEALAAAATDDVVAAFSGMGYYGRARRLHAAARAIVARGGWPRDAASLIALPGIGAYTSAAVAAFAFGGTVPPVDGNVCRVAARVTATALPSGGAALAREADRLARELHAEAPCPEVFEALMELGATVCTPQSPGCGACPLRLGCRGREAPERFPLPRPAQSPVTVAWVAVWLVRLDGRVLLRRIRDGGLLAGLWLPPLAVLAPAGDPRAVALSLARAFGVAGGVAAAAAVRHSITHHRIEVMPFTAAWPAGVREVNREVVFRDPAAPGLPTSSLLRKLLAVCSGPRQADFGELLAGPSAS